MSDKLQIVNDIDKSESWYIRYWRPSAAWVYLVICVFDFMCAPMFSFWASKIFTMPYVAWHPLTLEGGGLFHLSFGAILGINAWSRGQEKMKKLEAITDDNGSNNDGGDNNKDTNPRMN